MLFLAEQIVIAPVLVPFTLLSPREYKEEPGFTPSDLSSPMVLPPTVHLRNLLIRSASGHMVSRLISKGLGQLHFCELWLLSWTEG